MNTAAYRKFNGFQIMINAKGEAAKWIDIRRDKNIPMLRGGDIFSINGEVRFTLVIEFPTTLSILQTYRKELSKCRPISKSELLKICISHEEWKAKNENQTTTLFDYD